MSKSSNHPYKSPKLRIHVTDEIIAQSKRADSSHCMVAEAVRAEYPAAVKVAVDLATIRFSDPEKGYRYVYLTPHVAQQNIINFDQGVSPEPFEFFLRNAVQVVAFGKRVRKYPPPTPEAIAEHVNQHGVSEEQAKIALTKPPEIKQHGMDGPVTTVVIGKDTGENGGGATIPTKLGGRTPPRAIGRVRAFGLRAMTR